MDISSYEWFGITLLLVIASIFGLTLKVWKYVDGSKECHWSLEHYWFIRDLQEVKSTYVWHANVRMMLVSDVELMLNIWFWGFRKHVADELMVNVLWSYHYTTYEQLRLMLNCCEFLCAVMWSWLPLYVNKWDRCWTGAFFSLQFSNLVVDYDNIVGSSDSEVEEDENITVLARRE